MERLELRLMLAVCQDGSQPLAGDFNYDVQAGLSPAEFNSPLCYAGDISISSNMSVWINADVYSAAGDIKISSSASISLDGEACDTACKA